MEETGNEGHQPSMFDIGLSASIIYSLQQICRWASLLVYVSSGAIVLCAIFLAFEWDVFERTMYRSYGGSLEAIVVGTIIVVLAGYAFFLSLLYNFTVKVKKGIQSWDIGKIEQGMSSLKIYFILSAIFGGLYVLLLGFNIFKLLVS